MKSETRIGIICTIVCIIFLTLATYSYVSRNNNANMEDSSHTRFEIEYKQNLEGWGTRLIVVTDRETDVQYLITQASNGIGVATMRDTNGAVLLRE